MSRALPLYRFHACLQQELFPTLQENLDDLSEPMRQLATVICAIKSDLPPNILWDSSYLPGRPRKSRQAILNAFIAKAIFNIPTTRDLIERLGYDKTMRRLCGWYNPWEVPCESTFSRAFGEFAENNIPAVLHEEIIRHFLTDEVVLHVSRDSTSIEARERPASKTKQDKPKRKRGRPPKGSEPPKEPTRIERQGSMNLNEMLQDLPDKCDVGTKKDSKGYKHTWVGWKLHIDSGDFGIPLSCILTSASVHDSQVAIPLAAMTARRVASLYDLMDSAYDVDAIGDYSRSLGHVPIIDTNPRRNSELKAELRDEAKAQSVTGITDARRQRFKQRSTVERTNGRLKDEFGGRHLRVRGHAKAFCHLMFGILALTVDQLMRLLY